MTGQARPLSARPRRSALYMPGANARALEKAKNLPCDIVIIDLEDSVAPDAKAQARDEAIAAIAAGGFGQREVVLRVNGHDTPWGADDLAAARNCKADAILVPKVSTVADIRHYANGLDGALPLWAMIETCLGIMNLPELAAESGPNGLVAWVIGTNDLAKEMRCRLDTERVPLLPALAMSVTAARARGLAILDGVFNDLDDDDGLARQCAQGVAFGFDGKTLIHPRQLATTNDIFTPSAAEVEWSRKIVAAFGDPENASKGVLRLEGRMVERLHLEEAQRLIAISEAIG